MTCVSLAGGVMDVHSSSLAASQLLGGVSAGLLGHPRRGVGAGGQTRAWGGPSQACWVPFAT